MRKELEGDVDPVLEPPHDPVLNVASEETVNLTSVGDTVGTEPPELTPEEAVASINSELSKALSHIAYLESQNSQLQSTVLQLETKLATGIILSVVTKLSLNFNSNFCQAGSH